MSVTSIRLHDDLEKSLSDLAKKTDRSKNWLINQAIREYLEARALEESRWLETIPALESVKSGKSIPAEEVGAWLSSWGRKDEKDAPGQ